VNVAIIVWGYYRQFETAVEFWDETYSKYNPDLFFSLWDESRETCKLEGYEFDIHKKVDEKTIKNYYPKANLQQFNYNEVDLIPPNRVYFLIDKAIDAILSSNKNYDAIIVKRADAFEWSSYNIVKDLKENTVYTYNGKKLDEDGQPVFDFGDILFYGTAKSIIKFIKGLINSEYFEKGIRTHKDPDKYLWESDINLEKFPGTLTWQIVRPIFLHLFNGKRPLKDFFKENQAELDDLEEVWIRIRGDKTIYSNKLQNKV
jgi:hypothetical protein